MKSKYYNRIFFLTAVLGLILFALPTIVIDPLFHYHAPLEGLAYPLNDERYQNDGIVRHFEYDALITGTSMAENFRTSELDALFGVNSVKATYSAALYKELNDNILVALKANPELKMVLRSADQAALISDKDDVYPAIAAAGYEYPWYLTDGNPFTDTSYFLNKTILLEKTLDVVKYTRAGMETTSFDSYAFWEQDSTFGKEAVLSCYTRPEMTDEISPLTEREAQAVRENIQQNLIDAALAYPDVQFYIFLPPYSICYWELQILQGIFDRDMAALEIELEALTKIDNIKVFGFGDREDIVCNLDIYRDTTHYNASVNSEILRCMKSGQNLITRDNYQDYISSIRKFYMEYDYDSIYE